MEVAGPFEFPSNSNIKLYDLPGSGTKEFPLYQYPYKVNMDSYDAFLLVSKDRFYKEDAEIAMVSIHYSLHSRLLYANIFRHIICR